MKNGIEIAIVEAKFSQRVSRCALTDEFVAVDARDTCIVQAHHLLAVALEKGR
jgi:hypothetical protein